MSIFDYPRINFQGTIQLSPGTANNDDYAGALLLPASYGKYAGDTLALIDSKSVQPRTYGMSDADFMAWVQKAHTFDVAGHKGQTQEVIPAEWNYYGGMDMGSVNAQVIGVTTGPGDIHTRPDGRVPVTGLLGAVLSFTNGHIADVNSEGSPPATQFFIDQLTLAKAGTTFINGSASKGACQWLNFYRNVNLTADGGAGGYVYHVIRKNAATTINIPGFDDRVIKLFDAAIADMKAAGANIVDPANLPHMEAGSVFQELPIVVLNFEFKANINKYFESLGPGAKVKTLAELIRFNDTHREQEMPFFGQERLIMSEATTSLDDPVYRNAVATIQRMSRADGIDAVMDRYRLDALVAPTTAPGWLIDHIRGDRFDGGDSAGTAAIAGYPDVTVPMGFVAGLPVGVSFFGRAWSEPMLLKVAYAYEQATKRRQPPRFPATAG